MTEFVAKASIFVLASHAPDLMKQFCTRLIQLEHGKIVSDEQVVPQPPVAPVKAQTA